MVIKIDLEKLMAEMPAFIKKFEVKDDIIVPPVIVEPEPPITTPVTKGVDHAYLAANALAYSTNKPAVDGESVGTIPDVIGAYPLLYVGSATPNLTGRPPIFKDSEINFDNEPHTLFNSKTIKKIEYPYEETIVLRVVPGTGYEQFQNDWFNDLSIGDNGMKLRAGDADGNTQTFKGSDYEYFKTYVIHILAESGKQTMWLNGKNLGTIPSRADSRKLLNSVGVDTNNAQWNFIAKYVKLSKFSDSDRNAHLSSVGVAHSQGELPNDPYASSVLISSSASEHSAKYTYNGKSKQDLSKTQYRWLGMTRSLADVKVIGTDPVLPVSVAKNYVGIRVEVKVFDVDGKSFRFISMPFKY